MISHKIRASNKHVYDIHKTQGKYFLFVYLKLKTNTNKSLSSFYYLRYAYDRHINAYFISDMIYKMILIGIIDKFVEEQS